MQKEKLMKMGDKGADADVTGKSWALFVCFAHP
jgi:hypothetical protein